MSGTCRVIRFQIGKSAAEEAKQMEVSILKIRDKDEDQEALAIVRSVDGFIALALSLEHEGDVEVAFTPAECEDLVVRLQQAIGDAKTEQYKAIDVGRQAAQLQPV